MLEAATFEILRSHPFLRLLHQCVNLNVFELDALLEFVFKTVFSDKPLCVGKKKAVGFETCPFFPAEVFVEGVNRPDQA